MWPDWVNFEVFGHFWGFTNVLAKFNLLWDFRNAIELIFIFVNTEIESNNPASLSHWIIVWNQIFISDKINVVLIDTKISECTKINQNFRRVACVSNIKSLRYDPIGSDE